MPAWPSSLPQEFEGSGFVDQLPRQYLGSRLDPSHPTRRRRNRESTAAPMTGQMLVTSTQWSTLRTFYANEIGQGALAFDFPDPDDPDAKLRVAFDQPPEMTTVGGDLHIVSLNLARQ